MVARIETGKSIKGAVNYNENKVRLNKAELLFAENYLKPGDRLSFDERLHRLENLAARNERAATNCIHLSLNFDPKEKISDEKMIEIAKEYMHKIGFGQQPFLIYRHKDAAHGHCHVVSTNIKADGTRIDLHNIGKEKSEPIRKAIEKKYGLVPAEGNGKQQQPMIKPADLKKAIYGKSETKNTISNIVRTVVREYKFTSLAELNAILKQYNVIAERGEPDSPMFKNKGLIYSILDEKGQKIGVPIKASAIYTRPTLPNLEKKFEQYAEKNAPYKDPLKSAIDKVLPIATERKSLEALLKKENISVVFRENADRVYGITFIDHRSKTVFNGSDLGKAYSAASIFERLGKASRKENSDRIANEKSVTQTLEGIDYKQGVAAALAQMYDKGLLIKTGDSDAFFIGSKISSGNSYIPLSKKMDTYFKVNSVTPGLIDQLNRWIFDNDLFNKPGAFLSPVFISFVKALLQQQEHQNQAFAMTVPKKKKRRPRS